MSKHTPGPLQEFEGAIQTCEHNPREIGYAKKQADAVLWAAAPDLAEVVRRLIELRHGASEELWAKLETEARAALKKAGIE